MTDWEKLKVAELKDELKARGIPLTGLKLKQQLIDKLVKVESHGPAAVGPDSPEKDTPQSQSQHDDGSQNHTKNDQDTTRTDLMNTTSNGHDSKNNHQVEDHPSAPPSQIAPTPTDSTIAETADTTNAGLTPNTGNSGPASFIPEDGRAKENKLDAQSPGVEHEPRTHSKESSNHKKAIEDNVTEAALVLSATPGHTPSSQISPLPTAFSTRLPTPEALEDQRKRKRRSLSPPPDTQEMQKRVKGSDGQPLITRQESDALEAIREATALVQDGRATIDPDEQQLQPMEASDNPERTRVAKDVGGLPDALELQQPTDMRADNTLNDSPSRTEVPTRHIPPALHRVTSSLYIRNFKRPLHIPTLRTYISDLAKASQPSDDPPMKVFYLDAIRTHAFVSFTSTSAAIQVRDQMHGRRYPDEQMREPLWVDFIPDDKVQSWIDHETGNPGYGFGAGRSAVTKFEVSYTKERGTMEATLQIASESNPQALKHQQQPNRTSQGASNPDIEALGIRPDRVGLVRPPVDDWRYSSKTSRARSPSALPKSHVGTGFRALDELFSFTTAKPKLYYKAVPQSIVNERLDQLRNLTAAHISMGRSGDEGMKRYTFDSTRGREEWVDKGPEFGYGRKGQERLDGFKGRGRGGTFRGRARGGQSWRGDS